MGATSGSDLDPDAALLGNCCRLFLVGSQNADSEQQTIRNSFHTHKSQSVVGAGGSRAWREEIDVLIDFSYTFTAFDNLTTNHQVLVWRLPLKEPSTSTGTGDASQRDRGNNRGILAWAF